MVDVKNIKGINKFIVYILYAILFSPRIAIMPIGVGEISLRLDGVLSALLGVILIFKVGREFIVFIIFLLFILFTQGQNSFFFSFGLFLQVMSIFLLPYIFFAKLKFNAINESFLKNMICAVINYSVINVIIAIFMRILSFEYCMDGVTSTGCIGGYGILDRPYVFSVFVGSGFVLACAGRDFSFKLLIILLIGLFISDSRSIAIILFFLGFIAFVVYRDFAVKNLMLAIALIGVFFSFAVGLENKINLNNLSVTDEDPSWAMRLHSINGYFDWVDRGKIFFGDGALAFYQFSEQYGVPGPIDNLYFRLVSEVGILGSIILFLIYVLPIYFVARINKNLIIFLFYLFSVGFMSVFQESLVVAKSGHLIIFLGIFLASMFPPVQTLRQSTKFNFR